MAPLAEDLNENINCVHKQWDGIGLLDYIWPRASILSQGKMTKKKKKTFIAQTTLKIQYWDNLLIKPETHKQSDLNNYNRVPPAKGFCVADVIRMLILYLARFVLMLK